MLVSDHPAPVRDGRRELPHRLLRAGTTCGATRATRGAPSPTRAGWARRRCRRASGWFYERSARRRRIDLSGATTGPARSSGPRRTSPGPGSCGGGRLARDDATPHHDRWLLFVDEFDPHEPFDTPAPWDGDVRGRAWDGERSSGRRTPTAASSKGLLSEAEARQIRANYGAKLSMIDHWFGRILDALDDAGPVGRHRGHRVHRPRPLPRRVAGRATTSGASPGSRSTSRWATRRCWCTGRASSGGGDLRRAHDERRPLRHAGRRVRRRRSGTAPTAVARPAADRRGRPRCATGRSAGCTATGSRSPTAAASTPGPRSGDHFPLSMWSNRWSTMPLHLAGVEGLPDAGRSGRPRPHARHRRSR